MFLKICMRPWIGRLFFVRRLSQRATKARNLQWMLYKDNALDSNSKSNYEINKQIYTTKFLFPFLKSLEAIV